MFKEASTNPEWQGAMQKEMDSIHINSTWSIVLLPIDKKGITSRWVYKVKPGVNGGSNGSKACLIAHGYEEKLGSTLPILSPWWYVGKPS